MINRLRFIADGRPQSPSSQLRVWAATLSALVNEKVEVDESELDLQREFTVDTANKVG